MHSPLGQLSFRCITLVNASHQIATENLGVGSSLASHCTHIKYVAATFALGLLLVFWVSKLTTKHSNTNLHFRVGLPRRNTAWHHATGIEALIVPQLPLHFAHKSLLFHNGAHWCYHTVKGRLPLGKWFAQRVHSGYMTAQLKVLAPSTLLIGVLTPDMAHLTFASCNRPGS